MCQLVGAQQRAFDNRSAIVNFFNLLSITTPFLVSTYFRTRHSQPLEDQPQDRKTLRHQVEKTIVSPSVVLCPASPLPEFPPTVFCAREFCERVKLRSLCHGELPRLGSSNGRSSGERRSNQTPSDNSESECFGTRFFCMSIPRHCMLFYFPSPSISPAYMPLFLTLFIAAGLYPAFFFYSLGCHPRIFSHFHTFTHQCGFILSCPEIC